MTRLPVARRLLASVLGLTLASAMAHAQRGGPPPAPALPRVSAPIDLTGYWVSLVTEDWRYRVATPPKGDYASIPLNPAGRKAADSWDPARDEAAGEQCRAYGIGGVMRLPGRLQVAWQDDRTLTIETDAGSQVRTLRFAAGPTGCCRLARRVAGVMGPLQGPMGAGISSAAAGLALAMRRAVP